MIASLRYVMCDVCQEPGPVEDDAKEARASARAKGWRVIGDQDVCPKHQAPDEAVER